MQRASEINGCRQLERSGGDWRSLDADERHHRRTVLTGERRTKLLLDLPQTTALRDGDGLVLEDGAIVRVAGKPELLVEPLAARPLLLRPIILCAPRRRRRCRRSVF